MNIKISIFSSLLLAQLIACGGKASREEGTMAAANPCGENPCDSNPCDSNPCATSGEAAGPTDVGVDWSSWQSWTKVNQAPFVSRGHKKPWVNVYVPTEQAERYAALDGEMPQGFAVVKSVHSDVDGAAGDVQALTVMAKMGPDYDPDNGNWYYGVLSPDGSKAMKEGKLEMCIGCHSTGKDYLFGVPQ